MNSYHKRNSYFLKELCFAFHYRTKCKNHVPSKHKFAVHWQPCYFFKNNTGYHTNFVLMTSSSESRRSRASVTAQWKSIDFEISFLYFSSYREHLYTYYIYFRGQYFFLNHIWAKLGLPKMWSNMSLKVKRLKTKW